MMSNYTGERDFLARPLSHRLFLRTAFVEDGTLGGGDVIAAPGLGTAGGYWFFLVYFAWIAATGDFVGQGRDLCQGFD